MTSESDFKLVRLQTFSGPRARFDADLAKNILSTQGIPAVVPGETMAETLPGVDTVQVLVREEDAEEAQEILKSFLDSPQADAPEPLDGPERP